MIPLNIPEHTNCKNCGECCGPVPASAKEVEKIRKYLKENNIVPRSNGLINCCFRDTENKKCLIYPVRPVICRLFGVDGCGRMQCPNGNSASIDGRSFLDKDVESYQILNLVKWG
jgi:Fe-S-cluster containining protein